MKPLKIGLGLLIFSLGVAQAQSAASGAGNGGHAVVCYGNESKQQMVSVASFDYWEMAQEMYGHLDLGDDQLSVSGKIDLFCKRFQAFDPFRAEPICKVAKDLLANIADAFADRELEPVNDLGDYRLKVTAPCYVEQFAEQVQTQVPGVKPILISRRLYEFSGTSNNARAGIILHEAIYQNLIKDGATNSLTTREINFALASSKLAVQNAESFKYFDAVRTALGIKSESMSFWSDQLAKPIYLDPRHAGDDIYTQANLGGVYYLSLPLDWSLSGIQILFPQSSPIQLNQQGEGIAVNPLQATNVPFTVGGHHYETDRMSRFEYSPVDGISTLSIDYGLGFVFSGCKKPIRLNISKWDKYGVLMEGNLFPSVNDAEGSFVNPIFKQEKGCMFKAEAYHSLQNLASREHFMIIGQRDQDYGPFLKKVCQGYGYSEVVGVGPDSEDRYVSNLTVLDLQHDLQPRVVTGVVTTYQKIACTKMEEVNMDQINP